MTEEERKRIWEAIQKHDPLMAELLKLHAKEFGKPTEIRVKFKQEAHS